MVKLFDKIRDMISNTFGDITIVASIHGKKMYMPFSHNLPICVRRFKYYDTSLGRISEFLREKKKNLNYVDVGANIGDSILHINPQDGDKIIGVEPNSKFEKYLQKNLRDFNNVIIENVICSSSSGQKNFKMLRENGTARVIEGQEFALATVDTLDNIVQRNQFNKVDLIKVDTDGHDFEVLKGANKIIKKDLPTIFFECYSGGNKNYLKDVLDLFGFLLSSGYESVLVYDNFGYLFGKYNLKDEKTFKNLLNYQLNSDFYYYDILIMQEKMLKEFDKSERALLWPKAS